MTLDACAAIVEKGDPDRWSAVLAAPLDARRILIPIYAANLEIARAPFAATEPMIAEMRLQWWRDALEEIASGSQVRAHEVTTPLSDVLTPDAARQMDRICVARRRDCWNEAFATESELQTYLADTGGALMAAAGLCLGEKDPDPFRRLGAAAALSAFLRARPELRARGRDLSRDMSTAGLSKMAEGALSEILSSPARGPAAVSAAVARAVLKIAARDPDAIEAGRLQPSEFARRFAVLRASLTGRV